MVGRGGLVRAVLALVVLAGCGARSHPPPASGYERGGVPELRGQRVLVLPVQMRSGGHPDLDREIAYALGQAGEGIEWVPSPLLREALQRNPGTGIRLDNLPVRAFLASELERIGDPLFGDLYRLGVLVDAAYALLPVEARSRAEVDGEAVEIVAALLDVRTGRVLWFGVVEGGVGAPGSLGPSATAAEALARRVAS